MKLKTIIISVVVAGASIASVAACSHCHSMPEEHVEHEVERLTSKLELSGSQQHQLLQLKNTVLQAHSASGHSDKHACMPELLGDCQYAGCGYAG